MCRGPSQILRAYSWGNCILKFRPIHKLIGLAMSWKLLASTRLVQSFSTHGWWLDQLICVLDEMNPTFYHDYTIFGNCKQEIFLFDHTLIIHPLLKDFSQRDLSTTNKGHQMVVIRLSTRLVFIQMKYESEYNSHLDE